MRESSLTGPLRGAKRGGGANCLPISRSIGPHNVINSLMEVIKRRKNIPKNSNAD